MAVTSRNGWATPSLIALGLLARTRLWVEPDTAVLSWRAADLASVALNYYEHGLRFLYPETHWGGPANAWVEMELPLVPYLAALLYSVFGVHEWLGALLPYAAALAAPVALFALARRVVDARAAWLGAALLAVSPVLAAYSQGLMSDPVMLCLSVVAVLAFHRWADENRPGPLVVSGLGMAIAIALKPTAVLAALPMLWLAWQKFGIALTRQRALWAFAALCLIPPAAWYAHAHALMLETGHTFGVLSGGYSKLAHAGVLASPVFYTRLGVRLGLYHLTPLWALAAVPGFFLLARAPAARFFAAWLVAGAAMLVAVAEGTHQMVYYHFPVLPPACLAAGVGGLAGWEWVRRLVGERLYLSRAVAGVAVLAAVLSVTGGTWLYNRRSDHVPFARTVRAQADQLRAVLRPGAPVVLVTTDFSGGPIDGPLPSIRLPRGSHMSPPELLYHSRHRGWYLAVGWATVEEVESLRTRGAEYLVVADYLGGEVADFRDTRAEVLRHVAARYRPVLDQRDLLVFDLRSTAAPGNTWRPAAAVPHP